MKTFINDLEKLIRLAKTGIYCQEKQEMLKKWNLEIGDFIEIEKTKNVSGIIYNENHEGKIYVVLGILNGNLHVKGINNDHWGYLYFQYVEKFRKLKNTELLKQLTKQK